MSQWRMEFNEVELGEWARDPVGMNIG